MPTPDRFPGVRRDEGIVIEDVVTLPSEEGEVRYRGGNFVMRDSLGDFNPRDGGTGITEPHHRELRQLIHLAEGVGGPFAPIWSGAYRETVGGFRPTAEIWWESTAKLKKVAEVLIGRTGRRVTSLTYRVYDTDGVTVLEEAVDTITYSGRREVSRLRVFT